MAWIRAVIESLTVMQGGEQFDHFKVGAACLANQQTIQADPCPMSRTMYTRVGKSEVLHDVVD